MSGKHKFSYDKGLGFAVCKKSGTKKVTKIGDKPVIKLTHQHYLAYFLIHQYDNARIEPWIPLNGNSGAKCRELKQKF